MAKYINDDINEGYILCFDGRGRICLRWYYVYSVDGISFLGCFAVLVGHNIWFWRGLVYQGMYLDMLALFTTLIWWVISTIFSSLYRKIKLGYWDTESGEC